ncbi:MAG: cation diffusion facilitator family transporter [Spirochaetota bacterium]
MKNNNSSPAKIVWIPIAASVITIILKSVAFYITGSVGLLSDAMESFINLTASVVAMIALTIACRPPDKQHPFGHHKAEYFSSILEGVLIIIAAIAIGVTSIERLINPHILEKLNLGLLISAGASIINFVTARILFRAGRKYNSITLEADAQHLMTDVWTTGGVLAGLLLIEITGFSWLDPVIAIAVAVNIVYTGIKLIIRSVSGFMDTALTEAELDAVKAILEKYKKTGISYHALYTRKSSAMNFITLHLLMPGDWTVSKGHKITKQIEKDIKCDFPNSDIFIHLEPFNDPESFDDVLQD